MFGDLSIPCQESGPFAHPAFVPQEIPDTYIANVLCVGAGGLGCEILKCLALSGFRNISVIDMDTIESSNLNRQFLFSPSDVGRYKAEAAADSIKDRFDVDIKSFNCRIEEMSIDWFASFNVIIGGLDSIEARKYLNRTVVEIQRSFGQIIPLIDGGCEGFDGSFRAIVPSVTPCMECIDLYPPQERFPICTLANRPRSPEHCIEYALFHVWPDKFPEQNFDVDNQEHVELLLQEATNHGNQFKITGINEKLIESVVRNVIPAVASTNSLVASCCVFEAIKVVTCLYSLIDNFAMYRASTVKKGIYSAMVGLQKNPNCVCCGLSVIEIYLEKDILLKQFIEKLGNGEVLKEYSLKNPNISIGELPIFYSFPKSLREQFVANLDKKLIDLANDSIVSVVDPTIDNPILISINYR
ncbi:hypothetical protein P9112_012958 [Eukaryota sp. TZLM1-RC]